MINEYSDVLELTIAYSLERADESFLAALDRFDDAGVALAEIPMARGVEPRRDLSAVRQLRTLISDRSINIVHGHSAKGGFLGRLAGRTTHGVRSVYTPNASPYRLSLAYRWLERFAGYALSDIVIAVSESERRELIDNRIVPPGRLRVVDSGIGDLDPRSTQVTTNPLLVASLGRLSDQKAPLEFAAIAARVHAGVEGVSFLWVGDGELREAFEASVEELGISHAVEISGWVDDVDSILGEAAVFVLASRYESFGYGTVEAMRAGLPSVVSRVAGSLDVVEDGVTGFLVDFGDTSSFADRIAALLRDPAMQDRMGRAARDRWRTRFHSDRMVAETVAVYQALR